MRRGRQSMQRTFFSIGGGFIVEDGAEQAAEKQATEVPFPFHTAAELLATAQANELSISQLMLENECALVANRLLQRVAGGSGARRHRSHLADDAGLHRARHRHRRNFARRTECAAARAPAGRAAARERSEWIARRSAGSAGLGDGVCDGGERRECRGRARGDGADERRRGSGAGGGALLRALRAGSGSRRDASASF